ncbi:MAG: MotA/TolQ/ExbB proton channel family protein [Bdellovibrionales bacterium]|nr:MotA/TolQ/ExbB proton channel family protein [Bdellovibrionales bacterium]
MKSLILIFTLIFSSQIWAVDNLDELLKKVKANQTVQLQVNKQREQEFMTQKDKQKKLLDEAKKELNAEEKITAQLLLDFEKNEKKLATYEEQLNLAKGTFGELFGVVRQVAGDFRGQVQSSVISSQFKNREAFLASLAETKSLPSIKELEQLWFEIQREMTQSAKVVTFKTPVVSPSGLEAESAVTRVGSFNLVADEKYLNFEPSSQQIVELPRQPSGQFVGLIADLQAGHDSHIGFGIDPSRGTILSMLIQTPDLGERISQGGLIGYVILVLLALGLGLVIERWYILKKEGEKINWQLAHQEADVGNPLGKLIKVYEENKSKDLETLEVKLDEVIIKSLPKLKRGIGTIKILSAVAPLLGLLGTVTGMILTFQSITLFGTGDPKLMAGGISQALMTTVLGLVCAIPLLLLHNYISEKSKRLVQILEEQSAGLIASKMEGEKA